MLISHNLLRIRQFIAVVDLGTDQIITYRLEDTTLKASAHIGGRPG